MLSVAATILDIAVFKVSQRYSYYRKKTSTAAATARNNNRLKRRKKKNENENEKNGFILYELQG